MPKDALNDVATRKAKPQAKPHKLADGRGMYLLVSETGKYWRLDYRFDAKRKTLALGATRMFPSPRRANGAMKHASKSPTG